MAVVLTSTSGARRLAVLLAVLGFLAGACGDPDSVEADQAPPSTAEVPDVRMPLPMEVSEPSHTDVVALGDTGEFVVVDGYAGEDAQKGADVWLVSGEEARLIARYEATFLHPEGWLGEDGAVRVVGVPCEEFDQENDARCPDVPVHQLVISDESVERRELDLRVSTDTGVRTAGAGDGAVLTVGRAVLEDGAEPRFEQTAYQLDEDGELHELGDADGGGSICVTDGRILMFPSDVSAASATQPVIRELRDGELVTVATVEPLPEVTAMVLGCQEDGTVLVGTIGAEVQQRRLAADGTWSAPSPGVAGMADEDRHQIRWERVEGSGRDSDMSSELVLSVFRDGAWVEQGRVRSQEDPFHTSVSGDAVVAVIYQHPRLVLAAVR